MMQKFLACLITTVAIIAAVPLNAASHKPTEISVAYLPEWPTPSQFSQIKKTYDSALGVKVNWKPFTNGNEMSAALASGEVQIAYSQGLAPFLVGVTGGLEMTMIGIAVAYPESDLCIVANDSGITRVTAKQLEGQKVATRIGSVSHYRLLKILAHLGVDPGKVDITPLSTSAAATLRRGDAVMACDFGKSLRDMAKLGMPLMTGAEQEAIGLRAFDIIAVATPFMHQHPGIVQAFMDVTEASNQQWKINPDPMRATIARAAGMERDGSNAALTRFSFPAAVEQMSKRWMSEMIVDYTKNLADFFVEQGLLEKSLSRSDYNNHITTRFLR